MGRWEYSSTPILPLDAAFRTLWEKAAVKIRICRGGVWASVLVLAGCGGGNPKTSGSNSAVPVPAKTKKATDGPKAAAKSWPKEKAGEPKTQDFTFKLE